MGTLDMPELVWKRYIDLEVGLEEMGNARQVWLQLLEKSNHARVYVAYSEFEANTAKNMPALRDALERGIKHFKSEHRGEERAMILEHWLRLEQDHGDTGEPEALEKRQPKRVKKRRAVPTEDGQQEA